jgi:class 3 adenylate cyclase/pimeloyl-ACP methyl ester carboxylesterase
VSSRSIHYATTVDGFHIAHEVVGDGPFDLVYVPGWFSNLECVWEMPDLGDFLRELASFSRLIVFDRRGSGLSDRPFTTESLSLEVGMDDIRAVMDAAGSERAVLFGWEDGACLCSLFGASYPERTSALVLFGTWVKYTASQDYPWGWTQEQIDEFWPLLENKWGTEEFWRTDSSMLSSPMRSDPKRVDAWARYARLSASPGSANAIERMNMETDIRDVLPSVRVPTLVLHRIGDTSEPVEQARYIGERIVGAQVVELPGVDHAPFMGDTGLVLDELRAFVGAIREEEAEFGRVLATVLFTDLVGSTERTVVLGDRAWRELVEPHHAAIRRLLARYRGTEVDTAGDGFFATFDGPARGVRCAQAIVDAVNSLGLEVRAGVHTGEVETINNKVGGVAVNIGARIAALAGPGEVLVSSTVKDLTAGSGLGFEDAGEHELKGIPGSWHIYRVANSATT